MAVSFYEAGARTIFLPPSSDPYWPQLLSNAISSHSGALLEHLLALSQHDLDNPRSIGCQRQQYDENNLDAWSFYLEQTGIAIHNELPEAVITTLLDMAKKAHKKALAKVPDSEEITEEELDQLANFDTITITKQTALREKFQYSNKHIIQHAFTSQYMSLLRESAKNRKPGYVMLAHEVTKEKIPGIFPYFIFSDKMWHYNPETLALMDLLRHPATLDFLVAPAEPLLKLAFDKFQSKARQVAALDPLDLAGFTRIHSFFQPLLTIAGAFLKNYQQLQTQGSLDLNSVNLPAEDRQRIEHFLIKISLDHPNAFSYLLLEMDQARQLILNNKVFVALLKHALKSNDITLLSKIPEDRIRSIDQEDLFQLYLVSTDKKRVLPYIQEKQFKTVLANTFYLENNNYTDETLAGILLEIHRRPELSKMVQDKPYQSTLVYLRYQTPSFITSEDAAALNSLRNHQIPVSSKKLMHLLKERASDTFNSMECRNKKDIAENLKYIITLLEEGVDPTLAWQKVSSHPKMHPAILPKEPNKANITAELKTFISNHLTRESQELSDQARNHLTLVLYAYHPEHSLSLPAISSSPPAPTPMTGLSWAAASLVALGAGLGLIALSQNLK